MSADLLAMLNAGMPGASMSNRNRQEEGKTILTFKAGKMKTELQPNGKYLVSPDPRRGTLSLVWTANSSPPSGGNSSGNNSNSNNSNSGGLLKLEWKDRRTRTVVDSLTIFPEDDCTYSRVDTGRENDRVYLLQYGNASDRRFFFWLQEKDDKDDEDNCVKMNVLMSDAEESAKAAGAEGGASSGGGGSGSGGDTSGSGSGATSSSSGGGEGGPDVSNLGGGALDNQALMQIMQGLGNQGGSSGSGGGAAAGSGGSAGNATPSSGQVDALSSILENLGMPQNQQGSGGGDNAATTATPSGTTASATTPSAPARSSGENSSDSAGPASSGGGGGGGGALTLADLQGAMAGLSTATPAASMGVSAAGPPLSELATPESIAESGILDNEDVKAKLIALLPEGQRNEEMLKDTLRSPQVAQCLKSLTSALVSDDGSLDGLNSVLANFDLKAEDGAAAIASGNPIQAFLDCVLKSVEREKEAKEKESSES
uniref:Pru domain-containing protein n=1 Tax=Helicotheca tamesis TaxID=374047 RepID=A0A7S2GWZ2_9STRA|eukprot:CAMPEP_0185738078 /NCGR_PEP_ID=MMETSP1171-20130828/31973_1 /TAXON_ID=374046 /ORGANISM="Helicotheca tamensis, Strain CCMP826" /LENGTH=484 /DNA_ID=CAMNT_0028409183 /DNA_START=8 /DNA_END=1462 /DNA_ORIENTATION=-